MTRFIFAIAFVLLAGTAAAQSLPSPDTGPVQSPSAWMPRPPGTELPHEQLSREAMPYVLIFAMLPPMRALEAVGLGVSTVIVLNHIKSESDQGYDGKGSRAALNPRFSLARGRSHRHALIHRYY